MMVSRNTVFLASFLLSIIICFDVGYSASACPKKAEYNLNSTSGAAYRKNIGSLLSELSSKGSNPNGFYNYTSETAGAATVYGLFYCYGDVTPTECQTCVESASSDILRDCPNITWAVTYADKCVLRFSNESIFSRLDTSSDAMVYLYVTMNVSDIGLNQALAYAFNEIANEAAFYDVSGKKFAVRELNYTNIYTNFQKIYSMGQCSPDLSNQDCYTCLTQTISELGACCDGSPGKNVLYPSCRIRYETYPFFTPLHPPPPQQTPQQTPNPPPPPSLIPDPESKQGVSARVLMAIIISITSCIMLLIICFFLLRRRSRKRLGAKRRAEPAGADEVIIDPESLQYSLSEIETATNNFSAYNKIGQGGFGSVYKGKLSNGRKIAVKRLLKRSGQGAAEFKNEIAVVAKLQHRNLVQLLGYCLEREEKILVFEFVPRRSLDYFLFDPEKQGLLNWSRRRNIIGGIARGLLYLHEDSRLKIVHRDLKAGNILLDESIHPKIADFGMAKICGIHESEGNTTRIAGTFGYMAPEYTRRGYYSVKSDVFSFGVVILEIVTGKKNSTFYHSEDSEDLITYAWRQWRNGTPLALLDPTIGESSVKAEVIQCVHIGLLCVEEDANKRPTMASVVHMLNTTSVSLPTPQCPAVLRNSSSGNQPDELDLKEENAEVIFLSMNEASFTEPYPR